MKKTGSTTNQGASGKKKVDQCGHRLGPRDLMAGGETKRHGSCDPVLYFIFIHLLIFKDTQISFFYFIWFHYLPFHFLSFCL